MFKGEIKIHHKIFRKIEKEGTHSKRSILPWCQKQTRECVQSCFSHVWLSATLWTIACQASLSMDSPGFPGGSDGKSVCQQCGRPGIDPWAGKIPREGNGNPLQYSCLDNPTDGGAWWATVHGVAKSQTRLSDFTSPGKNTGVSCHALLQGIFPIQGLNPHLLWPPALTGNGKWYIG